MQTILIANRGEIAVRIIKTAKRMGLRTIAVFTAGEEDMPHVKEADCAVSLGNGPLSDTYLNMEKILGVALKKEADAIHPGYGFLSENAEFAEACSKTGVNFIGPDKDAIRLMGNKLEALKTVKDAGVPLLEQFTGSLEALVALKNGLPYPVIIKAAAGGGGKGMRIVHKAEQLEEHLRTTAREGESYFGDGTVFIERYLQAPRHIEVQVLGDKHGNYVHLFERECSIQRRHQKIIEEAPSQGITPDIRDKITASALAIARRIGYFNAGTVEFLMDENGAFYFLEMNTRIQVEHPVTEMITGVDLVREQIRIAGGEALRFSQQELHINGHAIEARIYAENPAKDFMPAPGELVVFDTPGMEGVRIDAGVRAGNTVQSDFDPMIAKIIAHAENRAEAARKLRLYLNATKLAGIENNRNYLEAILFQEQYLANELSTHYINRHHDALLEAAQKPLQPGELRFAVAAFLVKQLFSRQHPNQVGYWRMDNHWHLDVNGHSMDVHFRIYEQDMEIETDGESFFVSGAGVSNETVTFYLEQEQCSISMHEVNAHEALFFYHGKAIHSKRNLPESGKQNVDAGDATGSSAKVKAPMFGKVLDIKVNEDSSVKAGEPLLVLEAMKMENTIQASHDLLVKRIKVQQGDQVSDGQILLEVE